MYSELRAKLNRQIQVYMEKKPYAESSEVTSLLKTVNNMLSGDPVSCQTFAFFQIKKFKCGQDVTKHMGCNGRPSISKTRQYQIKKLTLNNGNCSTREVDQRVGVTHMTVLKY